MSRESSETAYVVFNGGKKDFHITETFTYSSMASKPEKKTKFISSILSVFGKNEQENLGMPDSENRYSHLSPKNSLFINSDTDMKHVFGGLNHASLFYQIEFQSSLSAGLAKLVLADQASPEQRI